MEGRDIRRKLEARGVARIKRIEENNKQTSV